MDVADVKLLTSWEGEWGLTFLYKIIDTAGNVLIWYASRTIEEAKKLRATVKDHSERDGIKQTIVTRCSVVAARTKEAVLPAGRGERGMGCLRS